MLLARCIKLSRRPAWAAHLAIRHLHECRYVAQLYVAKLANLPLQLEPCKDRVAHIQICIDVTSLRRRYPFKGDSAIAGCQAPNLSCMHNTCLVL